MWKSITKMKKSRDNIVTNPTVHCGTISMKSMTDYPPELYNEILKDFNFRYGKFNPIPYPNFKQSQSNSQEETNNE